MLALDGERKARPFVRTTFDEWGGVFSPDGRWLGMVSNESGRDEVYVVPFPGPGGKWQVSTGGGSFPIWARNGRELFYQNGRRLMAVDVTLGSTFNASTPRALFEAAASPDAPGFDISPDGKRFLIIRNESRELAAPVVHVVLGWFDELKARVPTGR